MPEPLVPRYRSGEGEYLEALRIAGEMARVAKATGPLTRREQIRLAVLLAAFSASVDTDHEFTQPNTSRASMGRRDAGNEGDVGPFDN